MKKNFELDSLGKSPARYDEKKLNFLNNFYIKKMTNKEIFDYLEDNNEQLKNIDFFNQKELIELINIFKDRLSSLNEIASNVFANDFCQKNFTNEEKTYS